MMQTLSSSEDNISPKIGRRISLHGNKGTIKYIGEVLGTNGIWLGIEWDNPDRGKHSGDKSGRQYFTCRIPNSGSFIRPSSAITYGQSFLTALISKYVETPHSTGNKETVILGSSNGAIEVEAVGLDKVRGKLARLERLRETSLDAEDVAFADLQGEVRKICPNVRSLDLSNSLLPSWDTVALITAELSALRTLSLNSNRFLKLPDTRNLYSAFLALEELRINQTMSIWSDMMLLMSVMPKLRYLEIGYNDMEFLNGSAPEDELPATKLEVLNLDGNNLQDWSDVMLSIAPLTSLDRIIVTSNHIRRIPSAPSIRILPTVKHLGIQENEIASWHDIYALNLWLPDLKTLNISGNPLLSGLADFRQKSIALLPSLEALNGTSISIKERTDSELYYLSMVARGELKTAEERERAYPRWTELCKKHGAPEEKSAARSRTTLADRLISIYVHHCDVGTARPKQYTGSSAKELLTQLPPPSALRVLPTMAMRLLRLKLLKSLKVPSDRARQEGGIEIWIVMDDDGLTKLDLEEESRDLAWWGIQDGSHIVVFTMDAHQN